MIRTLEQGYIPSLTSWPPKAKLRNNASARDPAHKAFLDNEVESLLESGAISQVEHKPWVVSPLQVVSRENKSSRLVFDVSRTINPYIEEEKVKLSSLEKVYENAARGDFFATTDLKCGYYHLGINSSGRRSTMFGMWLFSARPT